MYSVRQYTAVTVIHTSPLTAGVRLHVWSRAGCSWVGRDRWTDDVHCLLLIWAFKWEGATAQAGYSSAYSDSVSCCSGRRRHRLTAPVIAGDYSKLKVSPNTSDSEYRLVPNTVIVRILHGSSKLTYQNHHGQQNSSERAVRCVVDLAVWWQIHPVTMTNGTFHSAAQHYLPSVHLHSYTTLLINC